MADIKTPKMLKPLPPEKMHEVNVMLMEARRTATVARIIQEDWGFIPDVERSSLMRILNRHRTETITEFDVLEHNGASKLLASVGDKLERHVKVLDEYQDLIRLQKARIAAGMYKEGITPDAKVGHGKPDRQVTSDIMAMNNILNSYANIGLKIGLLRTMTPEEADKATRGVLVGELAGDVLTDTDLKVGLMSLIGNILEDVRASPDDA